jgi:hypothetical protein
MKYQIVKRRTAYAIETFMESWVLSARRFFPLFGAWILTLAGPVFLFIVGVMVGLFFDQSTMGSALAWGSVGSVFVGWGTFLGFLLPGMMIGWLYASWIMVSLKIARGLDLKPFDLVRPLPQTLSAFAVLLITTICFSALSVLIVPAALLFLKWQLAPFYIVDRGYGPIKALKQSWKDTDINFIPLLLLDLMFVAVQALTAATVFGPLICHIGLTVATAIVYSRWLVDENNPELQQIADSCSESGTAE